MLGNTGFSANHSFQRQYSLSDPKGLTAYFESTLPELSNDVKFVEIFVKTIYREHYPVE